MKQALEARFWAKVDKTPGHGPQGECWLWTAQINNKGYGRFATGKYTKVLAHRMSCEIAAGTIPEGHVVRHSCDTPACVNPAHLSAGTHQQNVADMFARGRQGVNSGCAPQTHCKRGHELTSENTIMKKDGRACRECSNMRKRIYRAGKTVADSK